MKKRLLTVLVIMVMAYSCVHAKQMANMEHIRKTTKLEIGCDLPAKLGIIKKYDKESKDQEVISAGMLSRYNAANVTLSNLKPEDFSFAENSISIEKNGYKVYIKFSADFSKVEEALVEYFGMSPDGKGKAWHWKLKDLTGGEIKSQGWGNLRSVYYNARVPYAELDKHLAELDFKENTDMVSTRYLGPSTMEEHEKHISADNLYHAREPMFTLELQTNKD